MSTQPEETVILGLRAQILGKYTTFLKTDTTDMNSVRQPPPDRV